MNSQISSITIVGTGLIGSSWASLFLAKGLKVIATDPAADAELNLRKFVSNAWQDLEALGLADGATVDNLSFTSDLKEAVHEADFIQENAPENLALKQSLYVDIENYCPESCIIASSTSSLLISDLQKNTKHPERFITAHPFTPPHLIPLVEIVGGTQTAQSSIDLAMRFYRSVDKHPIHVKQEAVGHIGNRLTSAVYKEAVYLVESGIASVEDVDAAISYGAGMRWAFMGPHLSYHLAGGDKGYRHYLDHLGPTQEERWKHHGEAKLTEQVKEKLISGLNESIKGRTIEQLTQQRDKALLELLKLKNSLNKSTP